MILWEKLSLVPALRIHGGDGIDIPDEFVEVGRGEIKKRPYRSMLFGLESEGRTAI